MFDKMLLISLLSVSVVHAKDSFSSERLLGIEVGYSSAHYTQGGVSKTNKDPEYGFRIGAQNKEWRTTLIGNFSRGQNDKYQKAMLTFDKFVWQSLYEKDHVVFKPYLGGHLGWIKHTADGLSENGLLYGAEAGVVWNVIEEVDFDLSYRYSISNLDNLKNLDAITIGLNYIY